MASVYMSRPEQVTMCCTVPPDWAEVQADPSRSASETELRLTQEDLVLLKRAEVAIGHDNATALQATESACRNKPSQSRTVLQEQATRAAVYQTTYTSSCLMLA